MSPPKIVIVEDDASVRDALVSTFEDEGYDVTPFDGVGTALAGLAAVEPGAVLLDIRLRDGDGLELLATLRQRFPHLPVIMATAYTDSKRTIEAMQLGAFDFVAKPFDYDVLLETVSRAVHAPPRAAPEVVPGSGPLVGSSPAMLKVWKAIGRAAASRVPVLITGESGAGKELVARAIHDYGPREGPFVAVNLAALPSTLIESELFGHERGAFTGATARRDGRFQLAGRGTLFLDEIGDLDLPLQTKILRVLDDGRFERVGGAAPIVSEARIVAATSKPVTPRTPGVTLREDLYYRLGVVRIDVPPLRDRRQDVPQLVTTFLRNSGNGMRAVSEDAMEFLVSYDWPGNVRELKHALENACIMSSAEVLDVHDFSLAERPSPRAPTASSPDELGEENLDLAEHVARTERRVIERALTVANGNRAHAARLLGIRRALLYARMKKYGLLADADES